MPIHLNPSAPRVVIVARKQRNSPQTDRKISMSKRSYNRRSDDEIIEDLQKRIHSIEARRQAREREDAPVLKAVPKLKKQLAKFAQVCMDHDRSDLSNTVMAFLSTLEVQAKQTPTPSRSHDQQEVQIPARA